MRKIFIAIAMAFIVSITAAFSGCNLIEVNGEKDMNQVVATVQIEQSAPKEKILKKDIAMAYLNYGYYYEQSYGYTREQTINLIVNNLIVTRVYVQNAILKFDADEGIYAGQIANSQITDKWDLERYLTEEEIVEATYLTKKDMDDLITSYEDVKEDEEVGDALTETVRTAPTNAKNKEEDELTLQEKQDFTIDVQSTAERRKAFNKVINLLDANKLLGEYRNEISETDFYKETLKNYQEQKIVEKFENCVTNSVLSEYDFADVEELFNQKFQEQKDQTDAEYSAALSSASASSPILYAPTGTYGYVYNLLLGISDEQKEELADWDEEHPNATVSERNQARKVILDKTVVKDLRSTWIQSGYDFDGSKFTGDYTFTEAGASLEFNGQVLHLNSDEEQEEDYRAEYGVKSVNEMSVTEFVNYMEEYVYGAVQTEKSYADSAVYKAVEANASQSQYNERINELLFAYSTDGGSLNTYKGYAISPIPDASNTETYMQEFADYGRKVVNGEVGEKGYIMVATDYGYHIMFFSECYEAGSVYSDLTSYLNGECAEYLENGQTWAEYFNEMKAEWKDFEDTENYIYVLLSELVSTKISQTVTKEQNDILNTYVYGENSKVVKYADRYQDLLQG